ncbi:MAG: hypothetical protein HN576_06410 [Bacteriovoracaceae bacterium]|nr:hypothetical protein [Bacteriovoracaceae bacterium]
MRTKLQFVNLIFIYLLCSSCTTTIHLLSSWGIPLERTKQESKVARDTKKELSCPQLVSALIQEKYQGLEEVFRSRVAKVYGSIDKEKVLANIDIILSLDYTSSFIETLNLNSERFNFFDDLIPFIQRNDFSNEFVHNLNSNVYLIKNKPNLNLDTISNVHRHYSKDKKTYLRKTSYREMIKITSKITPGFIDSIRNNKFLMSSEHNGYLEVYYPSVTHLSTSMSLFLQSKHQALFKRIQSFNLSSLGSEEKLNRELLSFLMNNLIKNYIEKTANITHISSTKKESVFIDAATQFFLGLISIRPFDENNIQVSRDVSFNLLFHKMNLIKPRIYISRKPLFYSLEKWKKLVSAGMEKTAEVHRAILQRIEINLPISNTPELFSHVQSFDRNNIYSINININSPKFKTFMRQSLIQDPLKILNLKQDPFGYTKKMYTQYAAYMKGYGLSSHTDFYISDDFMHFFKNTAYNSFSKWSYKMDQFYKPILLWKDVTLKHKTKISRENEIISYFKVMNNNLSSLQDYGHHDLVYSSIQSFDEFNQDVILGELNHVLDISLRDRETKDNSYGIILYKNLEAIKSKVRVENTKSNESKIIVGLKQSNKDIDLHYFSKGKAPGQGKTFAVGGIDPDAVMVVHNVNSSGGIISSYVRDPERPWRIKVFDGESEHQSSKSRIPASIIDLSE